MESTRNGTRSDDVGKLILRIAVGGLLLFHGVSKLIGGLGFVFSILEQAGLPAFLAYGTYVAEVVAPLFLIAGVLTRPAALIVAFDLLMAIVLARRDAIFQIGGGGGWAIELELLFLLGALAVFFLGSGRYAVSRGRGRWD